MAIELRRLVYRSDSLLSHDDIPGINAVIRTAVRNNTRDGITGCLALANGKLNQVLEGTEGKLALLMERITADTRHQNVNILGEWPIMARLFKGWAMAMPNSTPLSDRSLRIMTESGSGAQTTGILLTLMDQPNLSQ